MSVTFLGSSINNYRWSIMISSVSPNAVTGFLKEEKLSLRARLRERGHHTMTEIETGALQKYLRKSRIAGMARVRGTVEASSLQNSLMFYVLGSWEPHSENPYQHPDLGHLARTEGNPLLLLWVPRFEFVFVHCSTPRKSAEDVASERLKHRREDTATSWVQGNLRTSAAQFK